MLYQQKKKNTKDQTVYNFIRNGCTLPPLNVHKFYQCCQLSFTKKGILDTQYVEKVNKTATFYRVIEMKVVKSK